MRNDQPAAAAHHEMSREHHLVTQLREAMASKDIATMGRMLELLGTIQSELVMGKPVIDRLGQTRSDPNAGAAPGGGRTPISPKPAAAKPTARIVR